MNDVKARSHTMHTCNNNIFNFFSLVHIKPDDGPIGPKHVAYF